LRGQALDISQWLYELTWEPSESTPPNGHLRHVRVINVEMVDALTEHLARRGMQSVKREADGDDLSVDMVIYLARPADDPVQGVSAGCAEVLHRIQELARNRCGRPPRLVLVTKGAQAVAEGDRVDGLN